VREFYSSGFNAKVFLANEVDQGRFPHAELARVETTADRSFFAKLFYWHKIASLLFPENFIVTVGSHHQPDITRIQEHEIPYYISTLLSVEAEVDPNHARYSAHMKTYTHKKVSVCGCEACGSHRNSHEEQGLAIRAEDASTKMSDIGLIPPYDDPSDYCLSATGNVVFFEVEYLRITPLQDFIDSLQNPTQAQAQAGIYLGRLKTLNGQTNNYFHKPRRPSATYNH
jgi:hypothetical protein